MASHRTTLASIALVCATLVGGGVYGYTATRITPKAIAAPAPLVAGVEVPGITSRLKEDHPAIRMRINGSDGGTIDTLAGQFLSDILDFWDVTPMPQGKGFFLPPHIAASYNVITGEGETVCLDTMVVNAAACQKLDGRTSLEWDRGELLPSLAQAGNAFSIGMVLAHETGHLVDFQVRDKDAPKLRNPLRTLVNEQKADCYSGSWLAYVASGKSRRFDADAAAIGDAAYAVLTFRDRAPNLGHGIGVERINALLRGYTNGPDVCAQIDAQAVQSNRYNIPMNGTSTARKRYQPITAEDVTDIRNAVGKVTGTDPKLSSAPCPEPAKEPYLASWCASRGEVSTDFEAFAAVPDAPWDRPVQEVIPRGPGHKIGPLLAALVQPYLTEGGSASTSAATACAVGVMSRALVSLNNGALMDFGDLDEIVDELFTEGRSATASDGTTDEWSLSRVKNFTDGVYAVTSVGDCAART